MNLFDKIKTVFGWNGRAGADHEVVVEPEAPEDEAAKMIIEIRADKAEELLRIAGAEQKASVEPFGQSTVDLRERLRFSGLFQSEEEDDEPASAAR